MLVFTPLDIPPIPNKQNIIDNFVGAEKYVWWKEETLLGNKDFNQQLGEMKPWNDFAKQKYPELLHWIDFLQGCVLCTYPCSKTKFPELVFWLAKAAVTAKATANSGNAHLNFKLFIFLKFKFIL